MGRKAAVVVAGIVGVMATVGACGMVTDRFSDDAAVEQTIRTVVVATDSGTVKIRSGGSSSVHRDVGYQSDKPGPTHRVDGDTLVLEDCPTSNCWVDYDVVVPEGVEVKGKVDSGDVTVDGAKSVSLVADSGVIRIRKVDGPVRVESDSGEVDLSDIDGDVSVDAKSGRVSAVDVGGSVQVGAHSGDIEVRLREVGDVRARSDSGTVVVAVPQGKYKVTTAVESGSVENGIGNDPAASNVVDVAADSGDITIRYA